jgi:hypothetical protein
MFLERREIFKQLMRELLRVLTLVIDAVLSHPLCPLTKRTRLRFGRNVVHRRLYVATHDMSIFQVKLSFDHAVDEYRLVQAAKSADGAYRNIT